LALAQGAHARATAHFQESLQLRRELDDPHSIARSVEELAWVAAAQGAAARAARLLGAAAALHERLGLDVHPGWRADHDRALAAARAALDAVAFRAAWAEGAALPLEQVLRDALTAPAPPPPPGGVAGPLTAREQEVAALVARGWTNGQIAAQLVISEG